VVEEEEEEEEEKEEEVEEVRMWNTLLKQLKRGRRYYQFEGAVTEQ